MAEPPVDTPRGRSGRWAWGGLLLLAFGLRVATLNGREFWFDEALSATISAMGWKSTLAYVQDMPFEHPPLYYLILYPWQRLAGASEFALRFFSVFWGVLFIPLLYRLVRRLSDRRLGYGAAFLAALAPFMVAYSQEARMYTLLPCLAVEALYLFLQAIDRPGQPGWWLLYAGVLIAGMATHYLFAGLWLALLVYLLLEWIRRRREVAWGLLAQVIVLAAVLGWSYAAPGLRTSLFRLAQGEAAFDLTYKLNKIVPALILGEVQGAETPILAILLALGGWVLALGGAWCAFRVGFNASTWRLLMLVWVIPLLGSLALPYGVLARHLGYTLIALLTFMALALRALARRGLALVGIGGLFLLFISSYGLFRHYSDRDGDLRQAMAYLHEKAEPGDLLLIPQPEQRHLMDYYNRDAWPVRYLPEPGTPLSAAGVEETLQEITRSHSRLWLGPIGVWTADPELLVEQWLAAHAFQAEKIWFPASSSVALYFTGVPGLIPIRLEPLTWDGRIRLQRLQAGPLEVTAGDAIRLRFQWRAGLDVEERYTVILDLVGEEGQVWARRRSEPCGGWCPTDRWVQRQRQEDAHALLIPVGTPPGTYQVQVGWEPLSGGPALPLEGASEFGDRATIAQVTVLPAPPGAQPRAAPHPLQATFGGEISLIGYDLTPVEARPGETLQVETHWRAETVPGADYVLRLELVNGSGRVRARWEGPLSAHFYPTRAWQPGEYVRGQHRVSLPHDVASGRYRVRLSVIAPSGERLKVHGERPRRWLSGLIPGKEELTGDGVTLTTARVRDRDRRFRRPAIAVPLRAIVGKQAQLLGYDLDQSQAFPGGQLSLTLYWQAGGPMNRPFKVFTHLLDAEGVIRAQHDGPPGEGCCPTHTWVEGEIIVDLHRIPLSTDLEPGPYQLVIGMYEEETGQRLRASTLDGRSFPDNQVPLGGLRIQPSSVLGGWFTGPQFDFSYQVLLPMIKKEGAGQ